MIIEWIMTALSWVFAGLAALVPDGDAPQWLGNFVAGISEMLSMFDGLGVWVPLGLLLSIMGTLLACIGVGFTIKVIRIAASFLTAGGGSAG